MTQDNQSQEVSEVQLDELDDLLTSFSNQNHCGETKVNGDDQEMINSVSEASNFVNGVVGSESFLETMIHIKSSYSRTA